MLIVKSRRCSNVKGYVKLPEICLVPLPKSLISKSIRQSQRELLTSNLWHELLPLSNHIRNLIKIWSWNRTGLFYYFHLEETDFPKRLEEYMIFFKGENSCLKLHSQWTFSRMYMHRILLSLFFTLLLRGKYF